MDQQSEKHIKSLGMLAAAENACRRRGADAAEKALEWAATALAKRR
jgi:hypothetical protein